MAISKKNKGGDCYMVAGRIAMDIFNKDLKFIGTPYVVHTEVGGQGKLEGIRYGHAFIEDDENVYDYSNNREIVIPKQIYYYFGRINPDDKKNIENTLLLKREKKC
jgi:hypothetical protein